MRIQQLSNKVKSIDMYGKGVSLQINNSEKLRTWPGFFLSVLTIVCSLAFFGKQFATMIERGATQHQTRLLLNEITPDIPVNKTVGFNPVLNVLNGNGVPVDVTGFGYFEVEYREWNIPRDGFYNGT